MLPPPKSQSPTTRVAPSFSKWTPHAEAFRKVVTGDTFKSYLPVDQQFEFAKDVLAKIRANKPKGKTKITAQDIRQECWDSIESGVGRFKGKLAREAYQHIDISKYTEEIVEDAFNEIRRAAAGYNKGVASLLRVLRKGEFHLGDDHNERYREKLAEYHREFVEGAAQLKPFLDKRHLKLVMGDSQ
ncbi:MAG: hypothetical protein JO110_03495 [Acetobacteraceae bacterium]|nr:hypothetical protein [Acetobacteraceae bacterium]